MSNYVPLFITNFHGANQNPLANPLWEASGSGAPPTPLQQLSNAATGTLPSLAVNESHYDGSVIPPDQYAEITVGTFLSNDSSAASAPGVRHQDTYPQGYSAIAIGGNGGATPVNIAIYVDFGAVWVTPGVLVPALVPGDVIRLEIQGYTLTSKLNGVVLETYTDVANSHATGAPAITITGTNATDNTVTRFETGSIVGAGAAYSVPDCRDYGNFPNAAQSLNDTFLYDVPFVDSRASGPPIDCRKAGAPIDCRVSPNIPKNSRTPGTFGPGE